MLVSKLDIDRLLIYDAYLFLLTRSVKRSSFQVYYQLPWFVRVGHVDISCYALSFTSFCFEPFTVQDTDLAVFSKRI